MCLVCHSSSHNIASKMLLKLPVTVKSYLPRVPIKKNTMEFQPIEIYFLTGLQIRMQHAQAITSFVSLRLRRKEPRSVHPHSVHVFLHSWPPFIIALTILG